MSGHRTRSRRREQREEYEIAVATAFAVYVRRREKHDFFIASLFCLTQPWPMQSHQETLALN